MRSRASVSSNRQGGVVVFSQVDLRPRVMECEPTSYAEQPRYREWYLPS